MIEIGDKISFKPAAFFNSTACFGTDPRIDTVVSGTVVYINEDHRYYRVEYRLASGCIGHECFKF